MLRSLLFALTLLISCSVYSQAFMMQGWYWDYPKPGCSSQNGPNTWAQVLNSQASDLSGFSHLWLPPFSRASFGNCSNGYDPKDLYDLGEYGLDATGFGTRAQVDALVSTLDFYNIDPVADVVYNHRDGGAPEDNPAVKAYIETHMAPGKAPFPSDRYRCYLPIGGATGLGAGDYYFKISSKASAYNNATKYKLYLTTNGNTDPFQGAVDETEPNGGADCCQPSQPILLKQDVRAELNDFGTDCGGSNGCGTDEFHLTLQASDINAPSDRITMFLNNIAGGYSDHRIYGIDYDDGSGRVAVPLSNLVYQTFTDFTNMPSNQGGADYNYFKPNDSNASTTFLNGDWDGMFFFYDYDQYQPQVGALFSDWTKWLWEDVGIRGYRMDAVKHFDPNFLGTAFSGLQAAGHQPTIAVGEFFDSNAGTLKGWVDAANAGSGGTTVQVFDFALRDALKRACEDDSSFDVRDVFGSGIVDGAGGTGFRTVTFMNNHDFRTNGEYAKGDLLLGYVYLFTNNKVGLPCVFYPDYYGVDLGYYQPPALQSQINALMGIHSTYIAGSPQIEYLNQSGSFYTGNYFNGCEDRALIYQVSGGPTGDEVIVAINFCNGPLRVDQVINTFNAPTGTVFNDILGNSNFPFAVVSDGDHPLPNSIYIDLPPNSFSVWVQSSAMLPLDLLGFSAKPQEQYIRLDWQSANEVDFEGFELERSLDNRHFEKIAWVPGQGEAEQNFYTHDDREVAPGVDYYYRLKMVDMDGSHEYSEVRQARIADNASLPLEIWPNPTRTQLQIAWSSEHEGQGQIEVFNTLGQSMLQSTVPTTRGRNLQQLNTGDWPLGTYYVRLSTDLGYRWEGKVVKAK